MNVKTVIESYINGEEILSETVSMLIELGVDETLLKDTVWEMLTTSNNDVLYKLV